MDVQRFGMTLFKCCLTLSKSLWCHYFKEYEYENSLYCPQVLKQYIYRFEFFICHWKWETDSCGLWTHWFWHHQFCESVLWLIFRFGRKHNICAWEAFIVMAQVWKPTSSSTPLFSYDVKEKTEKIPFILNGHLYSQKSSQSFYTCLRNYWRMRAVHACVSECVCACALLLSPPRVSIALRLFMLVCAYHVCPLTYHLSLPGLAHS